MAIDTVPQNSVEVEDIEEVDAGILYLDDIHIQPVTPQEHEIKATVKTKPASQDDPAQQDVDEDEDAEAAAKREKFREKAKKDRDKDRVKPIDILSAFEKEPPELDFIWPGFLAGTVGALVAPGATGKSFWTLEATMAVAAAVAGGDTLGLNPCKHGRVVYLAAEDPEPVLIRRIHAIGQHVKSESRQSIAENLTLLPMLGRRLDIMIEAHLHRIIEYSVCARLIVLDTLSRIHTLDENNNGDMAKLISNLEYVAKNTDASVLYLHHTSKLSAMSNNGDKQQAGRGASSLIDNARWAGYVKKMDSDEAEIYSDRPFDKQTIAEQGTADYFIRFGISKQNYSEPFEDKWYKRGSGGVLLPVELFVVKKEKNWKKEKNGEKEKKDEL